MYPRTYKTKVKVTDRELTSEPPVPHDWHKEWNHMINQLRGEVSVQLDWGEGGIHGLPSNRSTRAVMAGTPFLRVVER